MPRRVFRRRRQQGVSVPPTLRLPDPTFVSPKFAHTPREQREACRAFVLTGRCSRGDACWLAHPQFPPAVLKATANHFVITAPRSKASRIAEAAAKLGTVVSGPHRGEEARGGDLAVFVQLNTTPCEAAARLADTELTQYATRALWTHDVFDDEAAAATSCARLVNVHDVARLRVWPPSVANMMRGALQHAGVVLISGENIGAGGVTRIIDAVFASQRWHTHVWSPTEAPQLLHWRGRPAFDELRSGRTGSRAYLKLDELLRSGAVQLKPDSVCVDVGASPGGWSARLSEESPEGIVVAIDPGELTLAPMPASIVHLKRRAEHAGAAVQDMLKDRGCCTSAIHWVFCDANVPPDVAARLALPFCGPDTEGIVISLKKFAPNRKLHESDVAACLAAMRDAGFGKHSIVHLMANGTDERTLIATR
jgi:FtsJ-like methyltransferase